MSEKRCDCDCDCGAALEAEVERLKADLSRCGKENCWGFEVPDAVTWVKKPALDEALAEVERLRKFEAQADEAAAYATARPPGVSRETAIREQSFFWQDWLVRHDALKATD